MEEKIEILRTGIAEMKDGIEKVNAMNDLSWQVRYERTDEGVEMARGAIELSKKLGYTRGEAYGKLNQAANRYLTALDEDVIRYLLDALEYFEKSKKPEEGLSRAHNFLAMVHESYGDYETALNHAQVAVEAAAKMEFPEGEGDGLSTLGLIYNRLCDFPQSLPVFKKSMQIRKKLGNNKAVASSLNLLARTYALSGDQDKAMEHYKQSLALRQEINDLSGLPWTYLGMATLLEKQEKYTEAMALYEKSLELNRKQKEKRLELLCMLGIGKASFELSDYQNADYYLHKALEIAEAMKAKPMMVDVYAALARYYEETGKMERALAHLKRCNELEREVNNLESHNRLKNQQIVFATEQSRREAEIFQLRNVELKAAYDEIEEINHEIKASITYAERIQRAVLPPDSYMKDILPEHFILFLPRDIVSGDFYWATKKGSKVVFTAADCTGHGIPGAFMSMLGVSYLNEIVNRMDDLKANEILIELRKHIISSLHQSGEEGEAKDGMDMALCVFDASTGELQYSGAYNSMYLIRNGILEEVKADRMPISIHHHGKKPFTNHTMKLNKKDVIYLFSDGYPDQFGGEEGKKLKYKSLKEILVSVHQLPVEVQLKTLLDNFNGWKGEHSQVDDVIIIGVKF